MLSNSSRKLIRMSSNVLDELVEKVRVKQPGLIVVDRAVPGKNQNYLTPENTVPEEPLLYPWESCIISGGGWSFSPGAEYMPPRKAIHLLINIVAKGGNLLLNIAPGPDGEWQDGAYDLLKSYGEWMKINSQAIYETSYLAPYKSGKVCMTQKTQGSMYFFYLLDDTETRLPAQIHVEGISPDHVKSVRILGSLAKVKLQRTETGFDFQLSQEAQMNLPSPYAVVFEVIRK